MRRIHAFEFHERPECPRVIREGIVETLGIGLRWGRIYDRVGERFAAFCREAGCETVVDMCSGSGEPVDILLSALRERGLPAPRVVLTDLLPNAPAMDRVARRWPGVVEAVHAPVDATEVARTLDLEHDARMVISAFHHFPPSLAAAILRDAIASRRALFIVEPCPRRLGGFLAMLPALALAMYAHPLLSPRERARKALLTYALPVLPALGLWDGLVSTLRMYTRRELLEMAEAAPLASDYRWSFDRAPYPTGGYATVFTGVPVERLSRAARAR